MNLENKIQLMDCDYAIQEKKISDSLLSSNFESINRYHRETDNGCSQSIRQINNKKLFKKGWNEVFWSINDIFSYLYKQHKTIPFKIPT